MRDGAAFSCWRLWSARHAQSRSVCSEGRGEERSGGVAVWQPAEEGLQRVGEANPMRVEISSAAGRRRGLGQGVLTVAAEC